MPQCPICETNYRQKKSVKCSCCRWNLNSDISFIDEKMSKDVHLKILQQQEININWAKSLWQKFLLIETHFQEINAERRLLKDSLILLQSQFQQIQSIRESILEKINNINKTENIVDSINEATKNGEKKDKINNTEVIAIPKTEGENLMLENLHCVARSETNQRENNEDSFQIFQIIPIPGCSPMTILAVADGMGGHAYGEEVSREALRKVSLALFEQLTFEHSINTVIPESTWDLPTLSKTLMNALEQANAYVQRMVKNNNWGNAGSTLVIVMIWENTGIVGYLGDSPMFHYQPDQQKLTKITEDHTVAGVLLRAGMITPEMARVHEGKSRLEFYIGCPKLPREAPIHHINLTAGDVLLLCSDGISGSFGEDEIRRILAQNGNNLDKIGEYLIKQSCSLGETDNQTLILWHHPQISTSIVLSNNQALDPFQTKVQQQ